MKNLGCVDRVVTFNYPGHQPATSRVRGILKYDMSALRKPRQVLLSQHTSGNIGDVAL